MCVLVFVLYHVTICCDFVYILAISNEYFVSHTYSFNILCVCVVDLDCMNSPNPFTLIVMCSCKPSDENLKCFSYAHSQCYVVNNHQKDGDY